MKKIKKLATWVLALTLCFSLTGVTAFASNNKSYYEDYYGSDYTVTIESTAQDGNFEGFYNDGNSNPDNKTIHLYYADTFEEVYNYMNENYGSASIQLQYDITGPLTLSQTGDMAIMFDLNGCTITSDDATATLIVNSSATVAISDTSEEGTGRVENTGSGAAMSVTGGTAWTVGGTYENSASSDYSCIEINSGCSGRITSGTTVIQNAAGAIVDNNGTATIQNATLINNYEDSVVSGNDATISGTTVTTTAGTYKDYRINSEDTTVLGMLDVDAEMDDEGNVVSTVTVTDYNGTVHTLVEGTDYTVSCVETDDAYVVTITLLDEDGEEIEDETYEFTFDINGSDDAEDEDDSEEEDNASASSGYYVSEVGDYVPGTLNVTLDENNEAVVTVTDADGNMYTLVEGTDYVVSYEEVDGTYVVTVTLLDENGDAYAEYEFGFGLYYVSEAGGWIPGTLGVTLDENNEAVVTVTDADGNVYTLVEGVDYTVTYTETDEGLFVTVTLLDENGEAYASYDFFFELGAEAEGTGIVKTGDNGRIWMYTLLAMAAAAAVALVLAGNKKYARK